MTLRRSLEYSAFLILIQGVALWLMGHPVICRCGYVKIWENSVWTSNDSQHLADWYSLGHLNHGILFAVLFALVLRRWSVPARLLLNTFTGFVWEVTENSDMIIQRFRAQTISFNYYGDSVINSMSDSVFMVVGFLLAMRLPAWVSLVIFFGIEALTTTLVRDGLIIDTIMLIHPIEAIKAWQIAGH